jgi:hypothetical protein
VANGWVLVPNCVDGCSFVFLFSRDLGKYIFSSLSQKIFFKILNYEGKYQGALRSFSCFSAKIGIISKAGNTVGFSSDLDQIYFKLPDPI